VRSALAACLLALTACGASAQDVTSRIDASEDSDDFRQQTMSFGATSARGFGAIAGAVYYSAPGWSADGPLLAATYQHESAAQQLHARIGAVRVADRSQAVGALDYLRLDVAPATSLGLNLERDLVASRMGIEGGLTYDSAAAVADHAFSESVNVGVAAGATWFSDDNRRPFVRTRWNYEIDDRWALNAYLKTRHYRNSDPDRPAYYSPRRLGEVSAGVSVRVRVASAVVLSAQADAGHQSTSAESRPIWSYSIGVGAPRHEQIRWSVELQSTNSAATASAGAAYRYTRVVGQLSLPF
jgi:hypothetical protein